MTEGLEYLRVLRKRGEEPENAVVISTVGDVSANLHVHLDLSDRPGSIDWSPIEGLEVFVIVGKGHMKRAIEHGVWLLKYGAQAGDKGVLVIWDIDRQVGVEMLRSRPIRSPYPELNSPEQINVVRLDSIRTAWMKKDWNLEPVADGQ